MNLSKLESPDPPWLLLRNSSAKAAQASLEYRYPFAEGKSVLMRKLRGHYMRSLSALMKEFGAALQFFDGFGNNWHALKECLSDMEESPPAEHFVLVITNANELLIEADFEQMHWLIQVLHEVGESWARPITGNPPFDRPAKPFHTVLEFVGDSTMDQGWLDRLLQDPRVGPFEEE